MSKATELKDSIALQTKVLEVIEDNKEIEEVDKLTNEVLKLTKKLSDVKNLKVEKMATLKETLPSDVFEYLFGQSKTVKKSSDKQPSKNTIKVQCGMLHFEGLSNSDIAKKVYAEDIATSKKVEGKELNFLVCRQLEELVKSDCVTIVTKWTPKDNYDSCELLKTKKWNY